MYLFGSISTYQSHTEAFQVCFRMSPRQERIGGVISFASQLASTVGLSAPNNISDVNIEFFESILEKISDFKNDGKGVSLCF